MARLPRLAVAGECHLVLQRGHGGVPVCADDEDRRAFLSALAEAAAQHQVRVYGFGLGDMQVQWLAEPTTAHGLSGAIQSLGRRYVAAFNRRHGRRGPLWDGRFRAGLIESPRHALDALLFVETAGVAAQGLADDPVRSSLAHHLGHARLTWVSEHSAYWALGNTPFDREAAYRTRAELGLPERAAAAIEAAAAQSRAFGSPQFVASMAERVGRPLVRRPRGRPGRQSVPN